MTLKVKKDGAWKEASSLKVKINGEWKDVSTLYSKKDGAWVTVYSSGALITFTNYPYPIPVAKGWKYSTDKVNWTTVTSDSTINSSGTFTGFIKASSITLSDYYTEYTPEQTGFRRDGSPIPETTHKPISFVLNGKGILIDAGENHYSGIFYAIDSNENWTNFGNHPASSYANKSSAVAFDYYTYMNFGASGGMYIVGMLKINRTGTISTIKNGFTTRVNVGACLFGTKAYFAGGWKSDNSLTNIVETVNASGTLTSATNLSAARMDTLAVANKDKCFMCGGRNSNDLGFNTVDMYDASGNKTTLSTLSSKLFYGTKFSKGDYAYVGMGMTKKGTNCSYTYYIWRFDSSGNRTTESLDTARADTSSFVLKDTAYICGGGTLRSYSYTYYDVVNTLDSSDMASSGSPMSVGRRFTSSFVIGEKGFVCGGSNSSYLDVVDIYYNQPESWCAKLPITEGSTYTLNGESGTAEVSKVMEFDSKVSGTIKYKIGTVPNS